MAAGNFITELRRRRVFRTAGLYIVAAWVVLQVADLAFESWAVPDEALRYVWMAAIVMFPVSLAFGWRYDITAAGIVRTPANGEDTDLGLKRTDYGILAALAAVIVISGYFVAVEVSEAPVSETAALSNFDDALASIDPLSIAVLPFATRSSLDETAFFADGIHDDLLTTLANVGALKVISRTSVLEYRDTTKKIPQIAVELGAANILEGGIQTAGDNVRINVQLIDAKTDEHLWAETYDRRLSVENLFEIQSEIVETIALQLAAALTPEQRRRINAQPTDNMDAYRAYVRGKHSIATGSFKALLEAEQYFREAIELDPGYVLPRIGLADAIKQRALVGAISIEEALSMGREQIDRALELDPENGYGQAVLGMYEYQAGEPGAEDRFKRSLVLNPNNVDAMELYATFLRNNGRHQESIDVVRRALELDPLSVLLYHDLGRSHIALGEFDAGRQAFFRISQINPENPFAIHGAAMATIMGGQIVEAGYWSDAAAAMDPQDYENPSTSVYVYGSAGNLEMAARKVDEALELGPDQPYPLAAQVFYYRMSGQQDRALAIARRALAAQLDDRWGSDTTFLRAVRDEALKTGDYGEALVWYRQRIPEVFAGPPQIVGSNIQKAADLAHLLQAAGRQEEAQQILESVVVGYDEMYTLGSANWPLGAAKAQALVLLGKTDDALAELSRIIKDGWRMRWRLSTELNPSFDSVRQDPRYRALIAEIERDIEQQTKAFADSPLSKGQ
jgi:TolB-like protein/Tfp pilus assembly protein PilF